MAALALPLCVWDSSDARVRNDTEDAALPAAPVSSRPIMSARFGTVARRRTAPTKQSGNAPYNSALGPVNVEVQELP
jgi:hypothetical protein